MANFQIAQLVSRAYFYRLWVYLSTGLYISYGIPILLRIIGHSRFKKGPWHLGAFSIPISVIAVLWVCTISILFILPQIYPVTSQTLNYSIVAVGVVIAYAVGLWLYVS